MQGYPLGCIGSNTTISLSACSVTAPSEVAEQCFKKYLAGTSCSAISAEGSPLVPSCVHSALNIFTVHMSGRVQSTLLTGIHGTTPSPTSKTDAMQAS